MKIPQQMLRANEVDTHKHTCFLTLSHVWILWVCDRVIFFFFFLVTLYGILYDRMTVWLCVLLLLLFAACGKFNKTLVEKPRQKHILLAQRKLLRLPKKQRTSAPTTHNSAHWGSRPPAPQNGVERSVRLRKAKCKSKSWLSRRRRRSRSLNPSISWINHLWYVHFHFVRVSLRVWFSVLIMHFARLERHER